MSDRTTLDGETSPLLGRQTVSHGTPAADSTARETDKGAAGVGLVWILMAVWSALFLGALDGA